MAKTGITQTASSQRHSIWSSLTRRVSSVLVLVFQLIALIALATIVINAFSYFKTAFIGSFIEHTMVFSNADSMGARSWNAKEKGLNFGIQLLTLDGEEISGVNDLLSRLGTYDEGVTVELDVINLLSSDSKPFNVTVTLQHFPVIDQIFHMVIPFVIGLVYLGCGFWVFGLRHYDSTGKVFSIFTASVAVTIAGFFEISTTSKLTGLWTFCLAMIGGTLINLAFLFPERIFFVRKYPYWGWLSYIPTVILVVWAYPTLFDYENPLAYVLPWRFSYILICVAVVLFIGMGFFRRFSTTSPIIRQQSQLILWGSIISFMPLTIWFFIVAFQQDIVFSPYLFLPLVVFPISVTYAILRYRMPNTDYVISRAILYALLTILASTGYALILTGLGSMLGVSIPINNPLVIGLMVFILVLLFNPLRTHLQTRIDRAFYRGQSKYRERAEAFTGMLNVELDLVSIIDLLRKFVDEMLMPEQLHIFVLDTAKDIYQTLPDAEGQSTTDIHFNANSALPKMLTGGEAFVFIRSKDELPDSLKSDQVRLVLLDTQLFIPLPGRGERVIGFMALGSRKSGEPYSTHDLHMLETLSDHAAIAIANAQLFSQLQAADRVKTEFVSQVSHELKNPMTSIKGYTDLLISGAVGDISEAQKNFLNTIRANVDRMSTIVVDLTDISRIESGQLSLDFSAVDIPSVVDEVVRMQSRSIDEKSQILEIQIPETLPAVWGDFTRLVQILINLVRNANKYTPEGGSIILKIESSANHFDPDSVPNVVHIAIKDSGLGMTPEDQANIFKKFFRSEDPKVREVPGTGLGLNITRNLVELQGGRIWFESEYGEGSTFHFTIPIAK